MMNTKQVVWLCFFFLVSLGNSWAQMVVKGQVADKQGALPGATVQVAYTSQRTVSNQDGYFSLSLSADSAQTLLVAYMGYEPKRIPLVFAGKKELDLGSIVLEEQQQNALQQVEITSVYRPSQARAMNMKKTSPTIVEVLAADGIGKLPDRNAAEAVQRMQGVSIERDMGEGRFVSVRGTPVQWSASTLNGNRLPSASGDYTNRSLQMDIFPSELIQYVKLAKALTPDMEGDAIGGSIDFITKTPSHSETFSANIAGGYVDQSHKPTYNGSVVYGNKISDKLSFIGSAVIWDRSTGLDNYQAVYNFNDADPVKSFAINQLQLRDYVARRRTLGFNGTLNYQLSENHSIYFRGLYSQYLDQQTVRESYFNFNQKNAQVQSRHADYLTDLYNLQLGGISSLNDKTTLNWTIYRARSSFRFGSPKNIPEDERGYPIVNFTQPMTYGGLSADGLKYNAIDEPNILPHLSQAMDASSLALNQVIISQNRNSERDHSVKIDLEHKLDNRLNLKGGLKWLNKEKDIFGKTLVWMPGARLGVPNTENVYLNQLQREGFPYKGGFLTELGKPYDDVIIDQITNDQIDQLYTDAFRQEHGLTQVQGPDAPANLTTVYQGAENVYAAYAMATWAVSDRLQLTGGLRNEYNEIKFQGTKVNNAVGGVETESVRETNHYNALLPMLNMRYQFNTKGLLRAALTRSFARPDFNSLNPGITINDIANTITEGNTQLKPTFSNNADLMFEYYFSDIGTLTAGAFYKDLKNVIYDNQSLVEMNDKIYLKSNPDNLRKAHLLGFEMGLSKRFTGLPGILGKMGFEGNYSFIDSEVDVPVFADGVQTGSIATTLPKQAKHIFNAILFYESNKLMLRVAGNYKGKYLNTIRSAAGPAHYQWFDKNFTLDFSSSYAIGKGMRIFLELNNLTNEPNRFYHGEDKSRPENVSYASFRGQMGLSFNLK
ncbi:MAG TPA: TonB-dependent receptor [Pseudosphingobacterium sp.]|nr:TonB-dependent receptor [Pseudosphingobacterium sp.]